MKKTRKTAKRGKALTAGKKLQKTKTLTTLSGPSLSDITISKPTDVSSPKLF